MEFNTTIKLAVIGCGHIGKRHAAIITSNKDCELVALCDLLQKDTLKLERFNVPFFHSIDELLQSGLAIDIIAIATPNGLHEEQAIRAISAGKHVLIEKPMALTTKGCERIMAAAARQNRLVFCVMQNRFSPPAQWLKTVLSQNILGRILMVQVSCYWNRDERYYSENSWHGSKELDGGTLFTQFSHFIDILLWFFGDITNIVSKLNNFNHQQTIAFEDSGTITFDFVNGGMGCLNYSTCSWDKNLESSLTLLAENGAVKIGGQYMDEVEFCHIKNYTMPALSLTSPPNDYGSYKGSAANHHYVYENLADILTGRSTAGTNAADGKKVVEVIEKMYAAAVNQAMP